MRDALRRSRWYRICSASRCVEGVDPIQVGQALAHGGGVSTHTRARECVLISVFVFSRHAPCVCCACAFFACGRATNTQTHSRARCFLLPLRPTHTTVHRQLERPHSAAPIQKQPKINIWPHAAPSPRPTIRHHSLGPQPLYHPTSHPGGLQRSMHSAIRTDGNFRLGTLARMAGRMPSTDRSFEPIAIGFCLWRTT